MATSTKRINDVQSAQAGAYGEMIDGKTLPELLQEIIDAINELDVGAQAGDTITGATFDGASRTLSIATDTNPGGYSVVIPTGSVGGGDGKLDGLSLSLSALNAELEASVSDGSTVTLDVEALRNRIYPVADLAARDAIANPPKGSIAFIDDADGLGNPGISGFADPGWTTPVIIAPGGGETLTGLFFSQASRELTITTDQNPGGLSVQIPDSGGATMERDSLVAGSFSAEIDRLGGSATNLANPAAGEYELTIAGGAHPGAITIQGDNNTLNASQEMVLRIDNAANGQDRRFLVQLYDANSGALVDQQLTGTVHNQSVSGNTTTITIPGLNGFGLTGFFIELR